MRVYLEFDVENFSGCILRGYCTARGAGSERRAPWGDMPGIAKKEAPYVIPSFWEVASEKVIVVESAPGAAGNKCHKQ